MVTKLRTSEKPSYAVMWSCLKKLKDLLVNSRVIHLGITKLDCGRDKLDWRIVRNMVEVIFRGTGVQVLVSTRNIGKARAVPTSTKHNIVIAGVGAVTTIAS